MRFYKQLHLLKNTTLKCNSNQSSPHYYLSVSYLELEPIILHGIDITYLKSSQIYNVIKDFHNKSEPENNNIIKTLSKEEGDKLEQARQRQWDKIKSLKVFFSVKPEIFSDEDMKEYEEIKYKIKMVIPLTFLGFGISSVVKFRSYFHTLPIFSSAGMVLLSYLPSIVYYSYWRNQEGKFIRRIMHKY